MHKLLPNNPRSSSFSQTNLLINFVLFESNYDFIKCRFWIGYPFLLCIFAAKEHWNSFFYYKKICTQKFYAKEREEIRAVGCFFVMQLHHNNMLDLCSVCLRIRKTDTLCIPTVYMAYGMYSSHDEILMVAVTDSVVLYIEYTSACEVLFIYYEMCMWRYLLTIVIFLCTYVLVSNINNFSLNTYRYSVILSSAYVSE